MTSRAVYWYRSGYTDPSTVSLSIAMRQARCHRAQRLPDGDILLGFARRKSDPEWAALFDHADEPYY